MPIILSQSMDKVVFNRPTQVGRWITAQNKVGIYGQKWLAINLNCMTQVLALTVAVTCAPNGDSGTQILAESSHNSFASYFCHSFTNLAYNIKHSNYFPVPVLTREIITLGQSSQAACLLGKMFAPGQQQQFVNQFQKVIWFSYRKNIKRIGDDSGWGCMIRGAQMLLAETLKRNLGASATEVIEHFRETTEGVFSLTRICQAGQLDGQWSSSSEVMHSCMDLAKTAPELNLSILSYATCSIDTQAMSNHFETFNNSLLISFHYGLYLPLLKQYMRLPQFVGCLGGISGGALYLLGYQDELVMCMDPHYVQDSEAGVHSYFKTHPRGVHYTKLSGSLSINFLIPTKQHCQQWVQKMGELNHSHRGTIILSISPNRGVSAESRECSQEESDEDQFEVIQ